MTVLYIYNDAGFPFAGVGPESYAHTHHALSIFYGHRYKVQPITPPDVIQGAWVKDAALFVMPGGGDLSYVRALKGRGNQNILSFVKAGGRYLGICAGAYYGSASLYFDMGSPREVTGSRELDFFKGAACGPTLAPYDPASRQGVRFVPLDWTSPPETLWSYYHGGCHFEGADADFENTEVLARYQTPSHPPAIIRVSYGAGLALLSGVHFEYVPQLLSEDPAHTQIKPRMEEELAALRKLQKHVLGALDLPT